MHYVGTDMRLWIQRGGQAPSGEEACLLHTPAWDFDWQQFYFYDAAADQAPIIYPGDSLWLQCTFDNTLDNPGVVRALEEADLDAPLDVALGEGSLDEMCIAVIGQVSEVPMKTADESHAGTAGVTISVPAASFTGLCSGPASVRIADDGQLQGLAACGLDFAGQLLTVEYSLDGSVDESGAGEGQITTSILGVDDTVTSPWSGSLDGDTLQISFEGAGSFSGYPTTFDGSLTLTATP